MKKHTSIILCTILSAVVFHTCVQIEVWNHLAGGILPKQESGKLRYSWRATEQIWRVHQSKITHDESLASGRLLTEQEKELFMEQSKQASRRNKVVSWSRGMGTFQYLLAPVAILWSISLLQAGRGRRLAGLLVATNAISIVLMLYRGYFND